MRMFRFWAGMLALAPLLVRVAPANAREGVSEYRDAEYGYVFQYPSDWEIRQLPEGKKSKDIRVVLQGPGGSSFMVVVEKIRRPMTREEFDLHADRSGMVADMIEQTIAQIYGSISRDIKAVDMKVGERRDLSGEQAVKFYISTLHSMAKGNSVIVAGIHVIPFAKDHMINFIMTAPWEPTAKKENDTLTAVFNSFHLFGAASRPEPGAKP